MKEVLSLARKAVPLLIMAAGLALMAWGCSRGEAVEVLAKAARICLECMGLGQ
jgi:hypothetical protein